jgi:hypothetical protein
MFYNLIRCFLFLSLFVSISCRGESNYRADEAGKLNFLLMNTTTSTNLPKSFFIPEHYWEKNHNDLLNEENRNERILATYGQNIYDGATWQIALAMMGEIDLASEQTMRLLHSRSGNMNLRASGKEFKYGDNKVQFKDQNAFFFRMISDEWEQTDPLTGELVGWMDWKPILGENAWAAFIGPLQVAYAKYKGHVPLNCQEVKLGLNMLPAIQAMQSPIGGIYHSTWGVWGKDPHDISTENNASLYAGLVMLKQILKDNQDPNKVIPTIDSLLEGIESFIQNYAYDPINEFILQGGVYDPDSKKFQASKDFAVDVQTWGIAVIGVEKIDAWFGEKTAYRIWQNTKKLGGFYKGDLLLGVGYTNDPSAVLSVEWTLGAILLVNQLSDHYDFSDLKKDAVSMREGIERLKEKVIIDGVETIAYDYADKRYYIPFGWWANKIPSLTSTAWVLMIDRNFNPFILGGGYTECN